MSGLQMKYFVLKPAGDSPYHKASRAAMKAYAKAIEDENIQLFHDLHTWIIEEQDAANRRDIDRKFAATEQENITGKYGEPRKYRVEDCPHESQEESGDDYFCPDCGLRSDGPDS